MEQIQLDIVAFYMFAGMIVMASLMILLSKNIVRSVFMLVVVFLGIAGIFMISGAEFVAVTQILVYIGGVLILMVFGIMLTTRVDGSFLTTENKRIAWGILTGLMVFVLIVKSLYTSEGVFLERPEVQQSVTVTERIGVQLMTDHILGLEIMAFLLLVALVGAAFISGNRSTTIKENNG